MNQDLEESWNKALQSEFEKTYFLDLARAIDLAYNSRTVYPPRCQVFHALNLCPLTDTKVVILGQDPYHGPGQAHGLSFSVPEDVKIPPSLRNIYQEIEDDIGTPMPTSGNLERWAKQGVLLLNATLTVEDGEAGFHQGWGWETFTDEVIRQVSEKEEPVVFLLWGKFAGAKESLIDTNKHLVLKAAHPSPLSAYRGFFGCKHFSKTNEFLKQQNTAPIHW